MLSCNVGTESMGSEDNFRQTLNQSEEPKSVLLGRSWLSNCMGSVEKISGGEPGAAS